MTGIGVDLRSYRGLVVDMVVLARDGVEADRAAASIRGNYGIIHGAVPPLWLILHSVVYRKPEGRCRTFCA